MPSNRWFNVPGIAYGGDYNPEQWPREIWLDDARLMQEAGVNLVSVGMWSWALMEPREGQFEFSWLENLLDLLHEHGVSVDLGTPTAAPPAWFFHAYPDSRVTTAEGVRLGQGSRGMVSPHSPAYHTAITRIAGALAEHFAAHPALVMWHIHNEYGAPVAEDHGPDAQVAFRSWLKDRYGDLEELNRAWGTAVWSQQYYEWDHITTPSAAPSVINPAQKLDFARFTDASLRACLIREREAIRQFSDLPVTTNFMANQHWGIDMWSWADDVDIISDDHYLVAADREAHIGLAIAADLTRSVAGGQPWLLLEHSPSGVNWQDRNVAKRPGEMARNAFTHVGRGADGINFFQWRGARHGQEKFHGAMIPHAGTDSRVFREVCELGAALGHISELQGSKVTTDVAMLWDFQSFWAQDLEWRPSVDLGHKAQIRQWYARLWRDHVQVDFVLPGMDLSQYKVVFAPSQYMLSEVDAANLNAFVEGGGVLVAGPFTAPVDEVDAVHVGGYMRPLEPSLGVLPQEYLPLRIDETVGIAFGEARLVGTIWAEDLKLTSAKAVATYIDGPKPGGAAITVNDHGSGQGWYIAACLDDAQLGTVFKEIYSHVGILPPDLPSHVEVMERHDERGNTYRVVVNHGDEAAMIDGDGFELLTSQDLDQSFELAAGAVAVIRTAHPSGATERR